MKNLSLIGNGQRGSGRMACSLAQFLLYKSSANDLLMQCDSSVDVSPTLGAGCIEHTFSIYSAYIEHILQSRGSQVAGRCLSRAWKYVACLVLMVFLGVGEMWGTQYLKNGVWMQYSINGEKGSCTYNNDDNNSSQTYDIGTLSSGDFKIIQCYWKSNADWTPNKTVGVLSYSLDGGSNWISKSVEGSGGSGDYEVGSSSLSWVVASSTNASGSYTFTHYFSAQYWWGSSAGNYNEAWVSNGGNNYKFTYKIAPPEVSGFTITPSGEGYVSGTGTSDDPFIINHSSGNLTLTITGSQAHTDANSVAEYSVDGGSTWSTSTDYITINRAFASTSNKSKTLKMRYKNSSASLTGTESSFTAYYKIEQSYTLTKWGSTTGGSYTVPSSAGAVSGGAVTATPSTGYNFNSWSVTSGSGTWESSTSTASNTFYPTSASTLKATFTAKNYSVKLDMNGGDSDGSITTTYNSTSGSSFSAATRAGYSCDGYFTASDGGSKVINTDGTLVSGTVSGWLSSGKWVKNAASITLYAHWTENSTNYTVTYGVKSDQTSLGSLSCATTIGGTSVSSGGEVVAGTGVTFTAEPITGYQVDGWWRNAACTQLIVNTNSNTFTPSITQDTTVYVKFAKKSYSITYSPSTAPTGCTYTTKPTTGTYSNPVTMVITPSTGYTVSVSARDASSKAVTISNPSANTYTFTQPASAVTVTVTATERMSTLSTSNSYDEGNPSYAAPTVSSSATTVGYGTTRTITAATASTGYTFVGWTLTNCTRTDGGGATTNPITIRSNGDGEAASVVARYEEDLSTTWTLKGDFVDDFATAYDFVKPSGSSTGSVAYATLNLSGSTTYHFQVIEGGENWKGNTGTMTDANCTDWTFEAGSYNNCGLTTTKAGAYRFKIDYSGTNPKVSVLYPSQFLVGAWDSWDEDDNVFDQYGYLSLHLAAGSYEFKVLYNGDWYGLTDAEYTESIKDYLLYIDSDPLGGNMTITVEEEGDYVFGWNGADKKLSIMFPDDQAKAQLTEGTYVYFDSRGLSAATGGWNNASFSTRFWLKNYASGLDYSHVDCSRSNVLEDSIFYALIPANGKVGQIQLNRMKTDFTEFWNYSNKTYAIDRSNTSDNCLVKEDGHEGWSNTWTPQWTTYCPPMSSVTLADNSTTTWGGNGSSENPYLVPTNGDIKVHVTASTSALNDPNMTKYFLFKKAGSAVGSGSSSTEKTITASSTTGTKEAVTVEAYNYYNSTEGTHLASSAIYYEARTPYTISYAKGSPSASISGSKDSEIKLKSVAFTLPSSAVFTRDHYTQTGWTTSDGGSQTHALGGSYTTDAAQAFYPVWTEVNYTVTAGVAEGSGTVGSASYTAHVATTCAISATPATGYKFSYWEVESGSVTVADPYSASTTITATSAGSIKAHFVYRWAIAGSWDDPWAPDDHTCGNIGRNASSKDTCFVNISLEANTDYNFQVVDRGTDGGSTYSWYGLNAWAGLEYTSATKSKTVSNASGYDKNIGIKTAGKGTYKFAFNMTDKTVTVTYPTSYTVTYGYQTGIDGAVTASGSVSGSIASGKYAVAGENITFSQTTLAGYNFTGWFTTIDGSTTVSGMSTSDNVLDAIGADANVYAHYSTVTLTFNATSTSAWGTAANWSPACVPTLAHNVVIAKPVEVNVADAKAYSVVIDQSGDNTGKLEIPAGKELVVATTVRKTTDGETLGATGEYDIIFDSDASHGLGALVMGSHDGTNQATVNFYTLSHGSKGSSASVSQYVGTPFGNRPKMLNQFYYSWMYKFDYPDESGNVYWNRIDGDTELEAFRGYCVVSADPAGHKYWMQGALVATDDKTFNDLRCNVTGVSGNTEYNNEHMFANSWMAPIKINAFRASDFGDHTTATIYIFNSGSPDDYDNGGTSAGQYVAYPVNTAAETDVIPAMQAFSVYTYGSTGDAASLTLDYSRLVYDPAVATGDDHAAITPNKAPARNQTKLAMSEKMHIYVSAESGYRDQVYMLAHEDFTDGFENGWDGSKIFGESVAPQLYAQAVDGKMAVNCVPTMEGTVLGFRKGTEDMFYTFSFDYNEQNTWYLNDLKEYISTPISPESTYTFMASDDDAARFIISQTPIRYVPTAVENGEAAAGATVRKLIINEHVYIIRGGRMYDATGVMVR